MKFLGYQILAIGIIWVGMIFFFNDMDTVGKYIFYGVTSWLLFLIVLFIKQFIKKENFGPDESDQQE